MNKNIKMGFNIAGLVINQNYNKDVEKLSKDLKIGIEVVEEITSGEACENWTPDGEFRLYFSDKATIIFFPFEWIEQRFRSRTANTLNYAYSATGMYFYFDLFNNGKLIRSIEDLEGERKIDYGDRIKLEDQYKNEDGGLIFALIDELLGSSFQKMPGNEKALRCKKIEYVETDRIELIIQEFKDKMRAKFENSPEAREAFIKAIEEEEKKSKE